MPQSGWEADPARFTRCGHELIDAMRREMSLFVEAVIRKTQLLDFSSNGSVHLCQWYTGAPLWDPAFRARSSRG